MKSGVPKTTGTGRRPFSVAERISASGCVQL